jgi:hypothetical protein
MVGDQIVSELSRGLLRAAEVERKQKDRGRRSCRDEPPIAWLRLSEAHCFDMGSDCTRRLLRARKSGDGMLQGTQAFELCAALAAGGQVSSNCFGVGDAELVVKIPRNLSSDRIATHQRFVRLVSEEWACVRN